MLVWTCKSLPERERERKPQVENNVAGLLLIDCNSATQFESWVGGEGRGRERQSLSIFLLKLVATG